jgi:hypothetical protein
LNKLRTQRCYISKELIYIVYVTEKFQLEKKKNLRSDFYVEVIKAMVLKTKGIR